MFKPIIRKSSQVLGRSSWRGFATGTEIQPKQRSWLKTALVVSLVGGGGYWAYQSRRESKRWASVEDETNFASKKKRLVVLGSGWAAVSMLRNIDTDLWDVVCISPRNYFLMTPLLPSVAVGTVETRTVCEPLRELVGPNVHYLQAECTNIDYQNKMITCTSPSTQDRESPDKKSLLNSSGEKENSDSVSQIILRQDSDPYSGSSSRTVVDSTRTRPSFELTYDVLVIAVGAENNTFNTPGVEKHAHFLKEIPDARRIRAAVADAFESAVTPGQTETERARLLHFIVVGGGPAGVEFAAELSDMIQDDLKKYFPRLCKEHARVTVIEALDHILSTYDLKISEMTEQHFQRENIYMMARTFVTAVGHQSITVKKRDSPAPEEIPCAMVVWLTGIKPRPLILNFIESIGSNFQNNRRALVTDPFMKVKGVEDVFAMGDCATIEQPRLLRDLQVLFHKADTDQSGGLDLEEFSRFIKANVSEYPQLEVFVQDAEQVFITSTGGKDSVMTEQQFHDFLQRADTKVRALPATAQVANQQGQYLATLVNQLGKPNTPDWKRLEPFRYQHLGSLAYIGGEAAVADFTGTTALFLKLFELTPMGGRGTFWLWRSYYLTEMFTIRTRIMLAFDWMRTHLFGRDISRV